MCLDGVFSLVPGVLSLLVVAVKDIMWAISKREECVRILVSVVHPPLGNIYFFTENKKKVG